MEAFEFVIHQPYDYEWHWSHFLPGGEPPLMRDPEVIRYDLPSESWEEQQYTHSGEQLVAQALRRTFVKSVIKSSLAKKIGKVIKSETQGMNQAFDNWSDSVPYNVILSNVTFEVEGEAYRADEVRVQIEDREVRSVPVYYETETARETISEMINGLVGDNPYLQEEQIEPYVMPVAEDAD